jgi:hypothetical protein
MRGLLFGFMAMVFMSSYSSALTLRLYQENENKGEPIRSLNKVYLTGAIEAIVATNNALKALQRPLVYCQPPTIDLDTAQLREIVTKMATKLQLSSDMPVADILLLGLQDAFPCEAK